MNRIRIALGAFALAVLSPGVLSAAVITSGGGPGGIDTTANLQWWLKADAITGHVDGQQVTTWNDSSGFGRNVTEATQAPVYRVNRANGRPALEFNGTTSRYSYTNVNNFSLGTIFAVGKHDTGPNFPDYKGLITHADQPVYTFLGNSGGSSWYPGENRLEQEYVNGNAGDTIPNITLYNVYAGTDTQNAVPPNIQIGHHSNSGGRYWDGDIAEVVIYNRLLNTAERRVVENHLSAKYGKAFDNVANDHFAAGKAAGYDQDVVGVGGEAGTRALMAGNAGFGVTVGSANIQDGEWIFAGHDQTTNSRTTNDIPEGVESRWDRAWFVETTGLDGNETVEIGFDASDAGLSPTDGEEFGLLFRSGTSGDFTMVNENDILSGDLVTFNLLGSDLLALGNGFFTLAEMIPPLAPEPGSMLLLGVALAGLGGWTWRRRRAGR